MHCTRRAPPGLPTRTPGATGRSYPYLYCRDALKLLNPAMFNPTQVEGAQPLLRPR